MGTEILRKTTEYVRRNIISFLFLAVILTGCFSFKLAAIGKYVSYIRDYTTAVSEEYFFTSDILTEEGTTINVGSFDGKDFSINISFRNYANAYRCNGEDQDLFFYVQAFAYTDENHTTLSHSFSPTVEYKDGSTCGTYRYVVNDGSTYTTKTAVAPMGYIEGFEENEEFTRERGTRNVTVSIHNDSVVSDEVYLVIEAHCLPLNDIEFGYATGGSIQLSSDYSSTLPDRERRAIYKTDLYSEFVLHSTYGTNTNVMMNSTFTEGSYTVECNLSSQTGGKARVYYDDELLSRNMGDGGVEGTDYGEDNFLAEGYPGNCWIAVELPTRSYKTTYFFRKDLNDGIDSHSIDSKLKIVQEADFPTTGAGIE